MNYSKLTIEELLEHCSKSDPKAQKALYERYSVAMYSTTVRILGNNRDAQEALQDSFVNAFKNLKRFDGRVTFGAWLKKITINVCLNKLRANKFELLHLDFDIADTISDEKLTLEPKLLNEAIEKLPSGCKAIFTLKAFEGFKHEEISKELNISASTSKSQFVRAKKLLQLSLKQAMLS
ncbi:MAG: RNA polymerase sigma factor [Crocinitomicaceae bacterium]